MNWQRLTPLPAQRLQRSEGTQHLSGDSCLGSEYTDPCYQPLHLTQALSWTGQAMHNHILASARKKSCPGKLPAAQFMAFLPCLPSHMMLCVLWLYSPLLISTEWNRLVICLYIHWMKFENSWKLGLLCNQKQSACVPAIPWKTLLSCSVIKHVVCNAHHHGCCSCSKIQR